MLVTRIVLPLAALALACAPLAPERAWAPAYVVRALGPASLAVLETCADGRPCWSVSECRAIDRRHGLAGAVAAGAAALAGGGALSTAFPDGQATRVAIGGVSAAVGVVSGVAVYLAARHAAQVVAHCTLPPPLGAGG